MFNISIHYYNCMLPNKVSVSYTDILIWTQRNDQMMIYNFKLLEFKVILKIKPHLAQSLMPDF